MNLLDQLRGEIGYVDPLTRARIMGALGDAAEEREAEAARQQRLAESEAAAMHLAAAERSQLARQGYTDRELADLRRQREADKQARVAELLNELQRLDPTTAAAFQAERSRAVSDMDEAISRSRAMDGDPFMRGQVMRFDQDRANDDRWYRQREIARLERELGGSGGAITRVTSAGFMVY